MFLAVGRNGAGAVDDFRLDNQRHVQHGGVIAETLFIRWAFVAAEMRDDKIDLRIFQPIDHLDGMFDAFPRHNARGLQKHDVIRRKPQIGANVLIIVINARRRRLEIEHVRNNAGGQAGAIAQFALRRAVNDDMLHRIKLRRKRHRQKIRDAVDHETLPLPIEIMMMRNRRDAGFGDKFRNRQPKRDVHGNGQRIFRDNQLNVIAADKLINLLLQVLAQMMNITGQ